MSQIYINNLTFSYENSFDYIFKDVSFSIDTNWKLGFLGRNGKGKTTFLNLLMGKYNYSGTINSSVRFDYFPYAIDDSLKNLNTIDIAEKICVDFELWKLQRELNLLKISEDVLYRSFNSLSGGEQTKIILAILFLKENNFLLIDEPTNHLDMEARKVVCEYLNKKKGFILVSHDRMLLDNCIDHVLALNRADIEVQKGNFSTWKINKERQDNFELNKNEKLKTEIDRLKEAEKRTEGWSQKGYKESTGERAPDDRLMGYKEFHRKKAGKLDSQVKSMKKRQEKSIEEKSGLLNNLEVLEDLKITPLKFSNEKCIDVKDLTIYYGNKKIFSNLNFTLNRGDRIALTGKNGSGKSSVLKLILGENIKYDGLLKIGSNLKISSVPQDTHELNGSLKSFIIKNSIDEVFFKAILDKFDFDKKQFDKNMEDYSEGQKKKIYLAKSLFENAHVYIWDEPLNYIDIYSRMQIEKMILKYNPTMIFIEHDAEFIKNIATKTVNIQ